MLTAELGKTLYHDLLQYNFQPGAHRQGSAFVIDLHTGQTLQEVNASSKELLFQSGERASCDLILAVPPRCHPSRSCRPGGAPAPPRGRNRGQSGRP